jgi:hypothetical protein
LSLHKDRQQIIEERTLWEWNEITDEEKRSVLDNFMKHGSITLAANIANSQQIPLEEAKFHIHCLGQLVKERFCGTQIGFF